MDADDTAGENAGRANSVARKDGTLSRILNHPLIHIIVGFLLTWLVGTVLTERWKDKQLRNDRALQDDRLRVAANLQSVQQLSELMYERRTRAELLAYSLRRNWPIEEVRLRKAAYDSAYVRWNRGIMQTQLTIRGIVDEKDYSSIESYVQRGLVPHLGRLDAATTAAYTLRFARPLAEGELDGALVRAELDTLLSCAYEITNALWIAAGSRGSTDTSWVRVRATSKRNLESFCPLRPDSVLTSHY